MGNGQAAGRRKGVVWGKRKVLAAPVAKKHVELNRKHVTKGPHGPSRQYE